MCLQRLNDRPKVNKCFLFANSFNTNVYFYFCPMDRRKFIASLTRAAAAVILAPVIKMLAEPDTITCNHGLLYWIEHNGSQATYSSEISISMFNEVIDALNKSNRK